MPSRRSTPIEAGGAAPGFGDDQDLRRSQQGGETEADPQSPAENHPELAGRPGSLHCHLCLVLVLLRRRIPMRPNRPSNPSGRQNRQSPDKRPRHPGTAGPPRSDRHDPGSEARIRGGLPRIIAKYEALARDAGIAGDPIAAQSYLQHAEHYIRLAKAQGNPTPEPRDSGEQMSAVEAGDLEFVAAG